MDTAHDPFPAPRSSPATRPLPPGPASDARSRSAGTDGPAPDGLEVLPVWLRRPVEGWGVRRSRSSWVGGVLAGVAERYRIDPLLSRGVFVALCVVSAGIGLLGYALAWAVLPDADGRVHYGRLRRGEWSDAPVAIAAIAAIGALNVVLGAGFTLIAPVLGGPGSLIGLTALAVLVWWLVTRWDGEGERRMAPAQPARDAAARPAAEPSWYLPRHRPESATVDAHGFRSDWIDPETGSWREQPHSREHRAAARLAEAQVRAAVEAAGRRPAGTGRGSHSAVKPLLGRGTRIATCVVAAGVALAVSLAMVLGNVSTSATLFPVWPALAALGVMAAVMTAGLLRGRRPGLLAPLSGILVGVVALQVCAHLLFTPLP